MGNEIVIKEQFQNLLNTPQVLETAKVFAKTEMVPKNYQGDPEAIVVAWQMGRELGLSPMQSLLSFAVVNGTPALYGDSLIAVAQCCPDYVDMVETFDENTMTAKCTVKRKGRSDVTETFSQVDAEKAGLWDKEGVWENYPKRMLKMRARGFAVRDQFPDVLRGIKTFEEVNDYVELKDVDAKTLDENADIFSGEKVTEEKPEIDATENKKEELQKVEIESEPQEEENKSDPVKEIFETIPEAIDFAIAKKKLAKGDTYENLPASWVKNIKDDPEKFKKAIADWKGGK